MLPEPTSIEWAQIATWLFCVGWSIIGLYVAKSLNKLSDTAAKLETSIGVLNTNVAVVIAKVDGHEKRIEKLEDRG